jgi:hypothetical protein
VSNLGHQPGAQLGHEAGPQQCGITPQGGESSGQIVIVRSP